MKIDDCVSPTNAVNMQDNDVVRFSTSVFFLKHKRSSSLLLYLAFV